MPSADIRVDYFLLCGSYETDRELGRPLHPVRLHRPCPGEGFSLDRIALPFPIGAEDSECIFTRRRPRH
ncbi:hypothetical protein ACWDSL_48610 [Streptomyces sp. NPDC000941]